MASDNCSQERYQNWHKYISSGNKTNEDYKELYNNWAKKYDHDNEIEFQGNGHNNIADKLAEFVPEHTRKNLEVIDLAAGTGSVGEALFKRGFKTIDAVDMSEGMLEIAKEKNVYRKLTCAELGKDKEIPGCTTISYDAVVMGGAFALAHVPIECLLEIARILKPGGIFVNSISKSNLECVEALSALEPFMFKMEKDGIWEMRLREVMNVHNVYSKGLIHVFIKN